MTHLDLFSGYGGFSLAFERSGFQTVAFCEVERFCCDLLAARWPQVPNLGDVREVDGHVLRVRYGPITVVTFGSPCQDWSVAGQRAGLDGSRSSLFYEAVRIVRDARPDFIVFENVLGLFSQRDGWDFVAVLDALADCGALDIAWRVLDAQHAGVPQRRRRIFVVADFRGERAGEILSLTEGVPWHPAPRRTAGQAVAGSLGGGTGSRGWCDDLDRATFVPETICIKGAAIGREPENGPQFGEILTDGTSYTLNCTEVHAVALRGRDGGATAELSAVPSALRASQGGGDKAHVLAAMAVRRLTPTECERLMGVPDGHTALPGAADGPRYRALGNGVAVPVVEQIAARMRAALERGFPVGEGTTTD